MNKVFSNFCIYYINFYINNKSLLQMNTIKTTVVIAFLIGFGIQLQAQKVFSVEYETQADIKVFVVKYETQADLKVYKVKYESEAKENKGKWFFTEYETQADKTIYFVKYETQADLKIFFVEYETQAGWRKKSKKHLMY